mmetsp:Transcript_70996/g.147943  ORF Transcript_70996/g.147943 Transcript_70996/m.147943 type:complete len:94 (+) Transcript_70996:592-873(+)
MPVGLPFTTPVGSRGLVPPTCIRHDDGRAGWANAPLGEGAGENWLSNTEGIKERSDGHTPSPGWAVTVIENIVAWRHTVTRGDPGLRAGAVSH